MAPLVYIKPKMKISKNKESKPIWEGDFMDKNVFISRYFADYIVSRTNPKTVLFSSLSSPKGREIERLFLAEGIKLSLEALSYAECEYVLFAESFVQSGDSCVEIADRAAELGVRSIVMSDSAFEKVSTEKSPQGVIAVVKYMGTLHVSTDFESWHRGKTLIMLDEIRDPGNLGTVIRTAEALGYGGVILSGCADIYNPKTIRASMGGLFRLHVFIASDSYECVRTLKNCGRRVIAASLGEETFTLGEYAVLPSDVVIIGNEGHGIPEALISECSACVKIPMCGRAESLNASVAATCIMWEYSRNKK